MSRHHTQLSIEEREKIQEMLWEKRGVRGIAREIGRPASTVSREINRNIPRSQRRYTPRMAHERAMERRREKGKRPRLKTSKIVGYVEKKLKLGWSPEQIAGRLSIDHPGLHISHEAIYLYIYGQYTPSGTCRGKDLRIYLRRRHKYRKRKCLPFPSERGKIRGRIGIDRRPKYILKRRQPGHWEGDSIVSRQSPDALNTLVERVSGVARITKLPNLTAPETSRAVKKRLKKLSASLRRTMTVDNGHENADHEITAKKLRMNIYFCNPYHSWEKGINENTNGLIRWYFPKKTDFSQIPDSEIRTVEHLLNTRPRKRLKFKTPLEVFNKILRVALAR